MLFTPFASACHLQPSLNRKILLPSSGESSTSATVLKMPKTGPSTSTAFFSPITILPPEVKKGRAVSRSRKPTRPKRGQRVLRPPALHNDGRWVTCPCWHRYAVVLFRSHTLPETLTIPPGRS